MMHEQRHSEPVKNDSTGNTYQNLSGDADESRQPPSLDEYLTAIGAELRTYAQANHYLTHEANNAAIIAGEFSKLIKFGNTTALHVILTVSPADLEGDNPFWHCSVSLVSTGSGKPKTVELWTKRERKIISAVVPVFLGAAGEASSEGRLRTKTALHCYRQMTEAEMENLHIKTDDE